LEEEEVNADPLRISALLLVPLALSGLVVPFLFIIPNHAFDPSWPMHARFHVIWGAFKLFALGIAQSLILVFAYSRGERWSWFALASNTLFGGMTIGISSWAAQGPVPPWGEHDRSTKLMITCLLCSALGLIVGIDPVFFGP
jgi:hypothetical protein